MFLITGNEQVQRNSQPGHSKLDSDVGERGGSMSAHPSRPPPPPPPVSGNGVPAKGLFSSASLILVAMSCVKFIQERKLMQASNLKETGG